jgi:hypothetical protein
MSIDNRTDTSFDRLGSTDIGTEMPALLSLADQINEFKQNQSKADQSVLKDPLSGGVQFASLNGFGDTAAVLGGWREMGRDVQAGKGKSVQMQLGVEGGALSTYTVPLDDIGNKKGKIITNGKEVKFVQSDGTLYNSEYQLQWTKSKNGTYNFSWK